MRRTIVLVAAVLKAPTSAATVFVQAKGRTAMRTRTALSIVAVLAFAVTAASPSVAKAQVPPVGWQHNPVTGHYYEQVGPRQWADAEAYAVAVGGHLVTINDPAEQGWLAATFTDPNLWIGMNDLAVEGSWVWSSGEPVTYSNFTPDEPNNCTRCGPPDGTGAYPAGEDVAVMNWTSPWAGVGWNDLGDWAHASAIIEVTLADFLDSMVADGALPNERVADTIVTLTEKAPLRALTQYLNGLVHGRRITAETMDQILAMVS
jgi:hypothetical protein